jgi:hypothetical protein
MSGKYAQRLRDRVARRMAVMMRWTNDTVGRTASVIGVALAYGITGCSAASDQPSGSPGTGGITSTPGVGGTTATTTTTTGSGATQGVVTPPPGTGNVPTGGGGTSVVGSGGTPVVGAGGTPIIGAGGTPIVGVGGTTTAVGGTTSVGGAATGGAGGDPTVGCGQGSFCQPADDLAAPAAADGFQIVSPNTITLTPGMEQFLCYYKNLPSSSITVGGFRSWMTKGASHHFIVFQSSGGGDGALQTCAFGSGAWVYATSKAGMEVGIDMPPQVGLPFNPGSQFELNMHLVNTGSDIVKPVIKLNVLFAKDVKYNAAAAYSALSPNLSINIPAMGTQTVHGTCTVPAGSNFFLWTTHTHKFATNVDINYVSGGQSTRIVNTTDWENPGTRVWVAPNFLTTKAGDSFQYACTYQNPTALPVTFGETASSNEMCMAIGYFFPAAAFSCI